jgi:hypothetical protein
MTEFPRTDVGGVSVSRMIIGTNWFMGYSHTSKAKDDFIKGYQSRDSIVAILKVFLEYGVDTVMSGPRPLMCEALEEARNATGKDIQHVVTPSFSVKPGGPPENDPEKVFDHCVEIGASICMPHQSVTDRLLDKLNGEIRDYDRYAAMIRERGMVPGLSTHMPEAVVIADKTEADCETYIQILNAAGFLMQVEADWVMRIIKNAKKPVMTIKPLAAGKLLPVVGLTFAWNAIREQDMVTIGTTTPDEAREVVELSLDLLERRLPDNELQTTRSKKSLQ